MNGRIKAVVVLILFGLAFVGSLALKPTRHLADERPKVVLDAVIPKAFGEWSVDSGMPVTLVSPDQQAVLDKIYAQTLSRTYVNAQGQRIMLSVAYGGDQSDATRAHRPEVCYPAQGFQVLDQRVSDLDLAGRNIQARQLITRLGGRIEPLIYWIVVGDLVATSGPQQKLAQLRYTLGQGVIPDGLLVRVSSIDSGAGTASAFEAQRRFLADLYRGLDQGQRPRIFGT